MRELEDRLAKAEAAREARRLRADVVEPAVVDAEPAVEPTPAPTRPARDALRELSIKQLRNILASRGGACTTCKEKDDLVAAVTPRASLHASQLIGGGSYFCPTGKGQKKALCAHSLLAESLQIKQCEKKSSNTAEIQ